MRAILGNAFIAIKEYQMKVAPNDHCPCFHIDQSPSGKNKMSNAIMRLLSAVSYHFNFGFWCFKDEVAEVTGGAAPFA